MSRIAINSINAPAAIGSYSQAARVSKTVYLSGQIPLAAGATELVDGDIASQIRQVFDNLAAVASAAGGTLDDVVKVNVYLTDLVHFPVVSEVMVEYFNKPYPARAAVQVAGLPKGAEVEVDAILELP